MLNYKRDGETSVTVTVMMYGRDVNEFEKNKEKKLVAKSVSRRETKRSICRVRRKRKKEIRRRDRE